LSVISNTESADLQSSSGKSEDPEVAEQAKAKRELRENKVSDKNDTVPMNEMFDKLFGVLEDVIH